MKLARTFALAALAAVLHFAPAQAAPGGYLGVYLTEDARGQAGALVEEVAPDSPAAAAGLRKGDRVLSVNGTATPHSKALIDQLVQGSPGQSLALRVSRDGWEKTLNITLGRRPGSAAPAPTPHPTPPRGRELPPGHPPVARPPAGHPPVPEARGERGFLGIYLKQGTEGQAIVDGVMDGGPAAQAGLRVNDQVVALEGQAVSDPTDLITRMGQFPPGHTVKLRIRRNGQEQDLQVTLGRRTETPRGPAAPQPPARPAPTPTPAPSQPAPGASDRRPGFVGIALADNEGKGPLTVDDVYANGPAERFGIRQGDVVLAVDGQRVTTIEQFVRAMEKKYAGDVATVQIEREGWKSEVRVTLGARPSE